MKTFLQFLAVACICLLTWHQATLHRDWAPVSTALVFAGILAAYLTARGRRLGYSVGLFLSAGYLAEVFVRVNDLGAASPLIAWALTLGACSMVLLWTARRSSQADSPYERHAQF
ncbi:MAG: hypothetical protein O3A53_12910 [Acidobacteria bacterium]|nr:hypothetical protein [Acidobacteriota bacterium]MDA1235691.1 hypothetical protein [Acidobacteriota bacterium]